MAEERGTAHTSAEASAAAWWMIVNYLLSGWKCITEVKIVTKWGRDPDDLDFDADSVRISAKL